MPERLDVELVNRGLVESREKGRALIMEGAVYVNGQKAYKAGDKVKDGMNIEIRGAKLRYVSRGGLKLEKALDVFPITLDGCVCMDIGASTGGFTDCMLQNGAKKVYAVDVGYGQLAWKLRSDERVVNMERTNIRYIDFDLVELPLDFISTDVSFISLSHVLPVAYKLLGDGGEMVALIKPQFEAGREQVGKKGVVRDIAVHAEVIKKITSLAFDTGFSVRGLDFSPIKGPEGNIEFLMYLSKDADRVNAADDDAVKSVTESAHQI